MCINWRILFLLTFATTTSLRLVGTSLGIVMSVSPWLLTMSMSSSSVMVMRFLSSPRVHLYQLLLINRSRTPVLLSA